jgi:carbonic anhydrase/acetyltransferase-like protein (isoleucine patch superfamily)
MLLSHLEKVPAADASAFIAPNATVCGDVRIGKNTFVMYGAVIIAEGGTIEIGDNCIILENAVLRSTADHPLVIGNNVLVGPCAHVAGCVVEDNVFIATGAAVFHGARLCAGSEVRIHGVVHIKTTVPENEIVPIGWVAVGSPVKILPGERHDEIWEIQKTLDFPKYVYGVNRKPDNQGMMPEITEKMRALLDAHRSDGII